MTFKTLNGREPEGTYESLQSEITILSVSRHKIPSDKRHELNIALFITEELLYGN